MCWDSTFFLLEDRPAPPWLTTLESPASDRWAGRCRRPSSSRVCGSSGLGLGRGDPPPQRCVAHPIRSSQPTDTPLPDSRGTSSFCFFGNECHRPSLYPAAGLPEAAPGRRAPAASSTQSIGSILGVPVPSGCLSHRAMALPPWKSRAWVAGARGTPWHGGMHRGQYLVARLVKRFEVAETLRAICA